MSYKKAKTMSLVTFKKPMTVKEKESIMNQTLKKNSAKRIVYIMVKGKIMKTRIMNIEKMQMIQVMKQRLKLKVKTTGKTEKTVGREVRKTHLVRKKVTINV